MTRLHALGLLSALILLCSETATAATVYKSVDANGVVTYSDTKPDAAVPVETIEIEIQEPPTGKLEEQRLQDMRETTDRMAADRMAREKHRAEMRQLDIQTAAQETAREPDDDNNDSPVIYGDYYPYPVHRPWHRPQYPRPEHPIARPPLLAPGQNRPSSTRPLPSNDYPASLIRRHYDPKVRRSLDR